MKLAALRKQVQLWSPVGVLAGHPRTPAASRLLVAGAVDRLCPPPQARALQDHWEGAPVHWHPGGSVWPLERETTRARVAAHLRERLPTARDATLVLTRFRAR